MQEGVDKLVNVIVDVFDVVDIFVNNVGGLIVCKIIVEMELVYWEVVMIFNVIFMFMMIKVCFFYMKGGVIVNFVFQVGCDGGGFGVVVYVILKGVVMMMMCGLVKEFGLDICVNVLCLGMIDMDFYNIYILDVGWKGFEVNVLFKCQGYVDDVVNLVLFLVCDDSVFIIGVNYDINGGMLMFQGGVVVLNWKVNKMCVFVIGEVMVEMVFIDKVGEFCFGFVGDIFNIVWYFVKSVLGVIVFYLMVVGDDLILQNLIVFMWSSGIDVSFV